MPMYTLYTVGTKADISTPSSSSTDKAYVWDSSAPNYVMEYNGYFLQKDYFTWSNTTPDNLIQHCCVQHFRHTKTIAFDTKEPMHTMPGMRPITATFKTPHPHFKYNGSYGYTYMTFEAMNQNGQNSDVISIELSQFNPIFGGAFQYSQSTGFLTRDVTFGGVKKGSVTLYVTGGAYFPNNGGLNLEIMAEMDDQLLNSAKDIYGTRIGVSARCISE